MTASLGFDKPLYILAIDHRDLLQSMSGSEDALSAEHAAEIESARAQIVHAKHLAYKGFEDALTSGVPKDKAGIQVDEQFGASILQRAAEQSYITACPAEKSGQDEFDFEYGEDFAQHIETFRPTFCKVQVRWDPEGDRDLNHRHSARLRRLSDYLHGESRSRLMLDLFVPSGETRLGNKKGDPRLIVEAIQQLQEAQVEPDVWGIEGLQRREDCGNVVAAARRGGRDKVGCVVLCESRDEKTVKEWMTAAAGTPGFIGFSIGRTIFSDPLSSWAARGTTSKAAEAAISRRYREFVNIFEKQS